MYNRSQNASVDERPSSNSERTPSAVTASENVSRSSFATHRTIDFNDDFDDWIDPLDDPVFVVDGLGAELSSQVPEVRIGETAIASWENSVETTPLVGDLPALSIVNGIHTLQSITEESCLVGKRFERVEGETVGNRDLSSIIAPLTKYETKRIQRINMGGKKHEIAIPIEEIVHSKIRDLDLGIEEAKLKLKYLVEATGSRVVDIAKSTEKLELMFQRAMSHKVKASVNRQYVCRVLLYEWYRTAIETRTEKAIEFLNIKSVGDATKNDGIYISSQDDRRETYKDRGESMLSNRAVGISAKAILRLNFRQTRQLITYLFSRSVGSRARAKMDLLSCVSEKVRNFVMLRPMEALKQSFSEIGLTREELLHIVFQAEDARQNSLINCPCCGTVITESVGGMKHPHPCDLVYWLVSQYQFHLEGTTISVNRYYLLKPGLRDYASALIRKEEEKKARPQILETSRDRRYYVTDLSGSIRKVDSVGTSAVHVENIKDVSVVHNHYK